MGTVRFGNDHVAAILGFGDIQWGNILILRVYFVEGLGHNLFSIGQFCDSDLEVVFRRDACFVRNLEGVDLLKGDRSTNLYTINLYEMASASPICLMARASSTKSWLWHQRLSHINFDTINDLAKNDLVAGLPKFKYHKEHLCPSLKRRNRTLVEAARTMLIFSRAPLFLWAEAIATACFTQNRSIIHHRFFKTPYELINGRKPDISYLHVFGALCYPKNDREDIGNLVQKVILVSSLGTTPIPTNSSSRATNIPITSHDVDELNLNAMVDDDYSRYTWVHFLRSKDEAPDVIIKFLKRITLLLQSPVIIIRTDNGTEFQNQTLVEAARTMLIFSRAPLFLWAEAIATACFTQNRSIIHRRFFKTPYELINGRKPDISCLHVFGALCYPKNDREDIRNLVQKIMETMNVSFDELLAMAFKQRSSKPGLQSMTSGHVSLGLDLTYASSTITTQQPSEGELDLLFEAMYDDYFGGQPSATARTVPPV
nr:integrase, catalytic region, zinc finger, CCHC-type, peptidase aspartic, catalytic [Tanacetum cinerariifolium]